MSYTVFKNPNMPDPLCDRVYVHYEKKGEIFTTHGKSNVKGCYRN